MVPGTGYPGGSTYDTRRDLEGTHCTREAYVPSIRAQSTDYSIIPYIAMVNIEHRLGQSFSCSKIYSITCIALEVNTFSLVCASL